MSSRPSHVIPTEVAAFGPNVTNGNWRPSGGTVFQLSPYPKTVPFGFAQGRLSAPLRSARNDHEKNVPAHRDVLFLVFVVLPPFLLLPFVHHAHNHLPAFGDRAQVRGG